MTGPRLVHLADLHLGHRRYQRQTRSGSGLNQREADVARAFAQAIDRTIALAPDVVVVAGDLYDIARPGNNTMLDCFRQFSRLVAALPNVRIVIASGNHDLPRVAADGCALALLGELPRVDVALYEGKRFSYPDLGLSVLAVPDVVPRPELRPDPEARYNVLLLHGEIEGVIPHAARERPAQEIGRDELAPERWDYVALGHYHVAHEVAPNAWYSGSIEYTSSNPWGELAQEAKHGVPGKGFIERDLATGAHTFHALSGLRRIVQPPVIDASGLDAGHVDDAIAAVIEQIEGGIDDAVVRIVVENIPKSVERMLNVGALRKARARALNLQITYREPERSEDAGGRQQQGSSRNRLRSLEEMLGDVIARTCAETGTNPRDLVDLGRSILAEVSAQGTSTDEHDAADEQLTAKVA